MNAWFQFYSFLTLHYFKKNSLCVKEWSGMMMFLPVMGNASSATCDIFIFSKNIFLFYFIIFIAFKVDYFFFFFTGPVILFFVSFVWQLDGERMSVI